jgi:phage shock protein C
MKKFHLDKRNGKFMGVCAGLANHLGIDPVIVRIGVVLATLLGGFPWTLIAYGVAAWAAKPKALGYEEEEAPRLRRSTRDVRDTMREIDRRMAEVETVITSPNSRLAREIEELR